MTEDAFRRIKIARIVTAYPFALILLAVVANLLVFGMRPVVVALPSIEVMGTLIVASTLIVINHSWLMTTTELTRVHHGMAASPEEWAKIGRRPEDVTPAARIALERRHNAHRNTTENAVYFALFAPVFALVSPPALAAQVWIVGFAVARLGYTYAYLAERTGMRGIFMSASLLSLYGMTSYLVIGLVF